MNIKYIYQLQGKIFPHNFRINPALVSRFAYFSSALFLLGLVLVNFFASSRQENETDRLITNLQKYPFYGWYHAVLGKALQNDPNGMSAHEFSIARALDGITYSRYSQILGVQSSDLEFLKFSEDKRVLEEKIRYWQKVASDYPDYDYANFMLAQLHLMEENKEKALEYLKESIKENPGNKDYRKLLEKISG